MHLILYLGKVIYNQSKLKQINKIWYKFIILTSVYIYISGSLIAVTFGEIGQKLL